LVDSTKIVRIQNHPKVVGMVNFGFCALTNKNHMGGHARHFNILTVLGVALSLSEPQSGHAQKCRLQLGFAPLIPSVQAHFQHGGQRRAKHTACPSISPARVISEFSFQRAMEESAIDAKGVVLGATRGGRGTNTTGPIKGSTGQGRSKKAKGESYLEKNSRMGTLAAEERPPPKLGELLSAN